ncbi:uncharacterized protein LOC135839246 [Planococcus citri]|uniref:uncharacterized protein LOC135839246 n=1 Tax=Planococcus citri TaxID=170843 RepID=UPI0031F88199
MYLDPRYKKVLNAAQQKSAISYLTKMYRRWTDMKAEILEEQKKEIETLTTNEPQNESETDPDDPQAIEMDEFEIEMRQLNGPTDEFNADVITNSTDLAFQNTLREFYSEPVISTDSSLETFWSVKKTTYPDLYEIYLILSAVPCTQADVERLFSGLKLVLSDQRNRLSAENLNNILLLRCNWDLVKSVPIFRIL